MDPINSTTAIKDLHWIKENIQKLLRKYSDSCGSYN